DSPSEPTSKHDRKMILVAGCVQPTYKPATNASLSRVLHRLQIEAITVREERCCGAASFHLDALDEAKDLMRKNIDAWWPYIEAGAEAIISTASGCGVMIKDYGHLLADDMVYSAKAKRVSELAKDAVEIMEQEDLSEIETSHPRRIAFQSPCTLQHGQKLNGRVEALLQKAGYRLTPVADSHLCCGSAGTYSVLQKELSQQLRQRKITHLEEGSPKIIATANIGCHLHLEEATKIPVKHWIELLDDPALPL
ncbi:MAG: glycolate oxidase subunit GlcF, partial [bacterium]